MATASDTIAELESIMRQGGKCVRMPLRPVDEVYQNVFVGGQAIAKDKTQLQELGITHILNCAQGSKFHHVNTDADFYKILFHSPKVNMKFCGLQVSDFPQSNIKQHFDRAVQFMDEALTQENGKVLVHCVQGFSRSASVAMAYLMMRRGMDVREAAKTVRSKREVCPNSGFMKQLCALNDELQKSS